ncbi:MAG TPA: RNA polymerase sigma factor [Gemmatimonadaceae bacterium]|nr:RNA polymerase sigma factor [Gemmatimonadaceae bacterium]
MAHRSDADLIADVLGGNIDAYGMLVRRYQDSYARFTVRMLGTRADADEALQSAFVRGFRSLSSCKDPSRFASWLFQIVISECRLLVARRARRERRFTTAEMETHPRRRSTDTPGGELEESQRALDQLDPEQREAFVLKHVEDLSYDEMAAITGANVSALRMRVKRAYDRLRELQHTEESYS